MIAEYFIAVVSHISRSVVVELLLGHTRGFDIENPMECIEEADAGRPENSTHCKSKTFCF